MAKSISHVVLDRALNYIKDNANGLIICNNIPITYNDVITYKLGEKIISSSDFSGPSNGDISGRKITLSAINSVPITLINGGSARSVAIADMTNEIVLMVFPFVTNNVSYGQAINIPAIKYEIEDPN